MGTTSPRELTTLIAELKERFPHGHPRYVELSLLELQLHNEKNHDYAKGGSPLGNFERRSKLMKLWPGFDWDSPFGIAMDGTLKQLDAAMHMRAQKVEAKVEDIPTRLKDIVVYTKIAIILYEEEETSNG